MNTTTETSYQLERDRAELMRQQSFLNPLPDLAMRRDAVQDAQTRADVAPDDVDRKYALSAAQRLLSDALAAHERSTQLGNQIADLTERLGMAQRRERQQAIDLSDSRLERAINEYRTLALATAKAYRQLLTANRLAQNTPGAKTTSPSANFNIPHLAVDGGQTFSLGTQMQQGLMSWEQIEQLEAA